MCRISDPSTVKTEMKDTALIRKMFSLIIHGVVRLVLRRHWPSGTLSHFPVCHQFSSECFSEGVKIKFLTHLYIGNKGSSWTFSFFCFAYLILTWSFKPQRSLEHPSVSLYDQETGQHTLLQKIAESLTQKLNRFRNRSAEGYLYSQMTSVCWKSS